MDQIKGVGYDGKLWLLIDEVTQKSVERGQVLTDFRGEKEMVRGGTGRIRMAPGSEYFPGVYGCKWIKL